MHETFAAPAHWRAIDFISDLHLAENTPLVFEAWAAHMRHTRADAVFILGDLFEVWIGDDMAERGFEARCVEVLRRAAEARTIAFMPGNRDFLVGDAMLEASGVMRLADPTLVLAFDQRVPKEELASEGPVEPRQLNPAPRDDLDAEQRDLLVGGCRTRRLRPVRLAQLALGEVAGEGQGRDARRRLVPHVLGRAPATQLGGPERGERAFGPHVGGDAIEQGGEVHAGG